MSFLLLTAAVVLGSARVPEKPPVLVITTSKGVIEVQLDPVHAPETTKNFLRYVDAGHYTGGRFHRTVTMANQPDKKVKIEVIQAGVNPARSARFGPIKLERTTKSGILHKDGTISMARDKPDSATSDFFICIGDQPELDFAGKRNPDGQGFAAFGKVTKGMDVVRKIQRSPAKDQSLAPAITILSIKRRAN
jgi:peptidyl-prolyl cis-trans isomerase A (cyclophilin A)